MSGKKQGTHLILGPTELTALRDIHGGLPMFVPARQTDSLITQGLVSRRLDGRLVLTAEGLLSINAAPKGAPRA
jgi:hypothetical protein